jgi:membrane-bound lytic murein transglycosylase
MQVQGSGLVRLREGGSVRLTYVGKNAHPYTSIGKLLVERGELASGAASMQAVKEWLRAVVARGRRLRAENASYVFFRELGGDDEARDGPLGAEGVALTAGRSLAVDAAIHALGTPIYVTAPGLITPEGGALPALDDRPGHRLGDPWAGARRYLLGLRRGGGRHRRGHYCGGTLHRAAAESLRGPS